MTPMEKAARLPAMAAIARARGTSRAAGRASTPSKPNESAERRTFTQKGHEVVTNEETNPIQAQHFRQFVLGDDGQPLPLGTPEQTEAADLVPAEWVNLGLVTFVVVDHDRKELIFATGAATEDGQPVVGLRVRFLDAVHDQPRPAMGDVLAVQAADARLRFYVQWTGADFAAEVPPGSSYETPPEAWHRNEALAVDVDEALLVLTVDA